MPQFHMGKGDQRRLENLPWYVSLEAWPEHGIIGLAVRRGEPGHLVIFVESEGRRYAIKETTPHEELTWLLKQQKLSDEQTR